MDDKILYLYAKDMTTREIVDTESIDVLSLLAQKHPRYGFRKLFKRLRLSGHPWNHKRVYRIYCSLKLNLRRKTKKRLPTRKPEPLAVPTIETCELIEVTRS